MFERLKAYSFDTWLGNEEGIKWVQAAISCRSCGYRYGAIWREDRMEPRCPRCVPSDRWVIIE